METFHNNWWRKEFSPAANRGIDYISRDGKTALEIKTTANGSRDLYSAVMRLAIFLNRNADVRRACLVLIRSRMSSERLKDEWRSSLAVLQGATAERLRLAVVGGPETWIEPDDAYVQRIAHAFDAQSHEDACGRRDLVQQPSGQKPYEVLKVLIARWLQKDGPIAIGELAKEVGCSYPTVRKALGKAPLRHALRTATNRSVELKAFPHDAWNELVAFSRVSRVSIRFQDRSGTRPTPQDLLKRLEKLKPPHLALGGVMAARHWHPGFDLNGTPRLDLVCHAPRGTADLSFVQRLDPALKRSDDPSASAVLVVHVLSRAASLFAENSLGALPWADAVEVILDLYDLSLNSQANRLLSHLRPETRLG
jgi:hypothetical protein